MSHVKDVTMTTGLATSIDNSLFSIYFQNCFGVLATFAQDESDERNLIENKPKNDILQGSRKLTCL